MQEGFLFNYLNNQYNDDAYFIQNALEYNIDLDINIFIESWIFVKKSFSSLRSKFIWGENNYEIIEKYSPFEL